MENIKNYVDRFETKYEEGFTNSEIKQVIKAFPRMNKKYFFAALDGITCIVKDGNIITYHDDIEKALRCATEDRKQSWYEFD